MPMLPVDPRTAMRFVLLLVEVESAGGLVMGIAGGRRERVCQFVGGIDAARYAAIQEPRIARVSHRSCTL